MAINLDCPRCQTTLQVPNARAGGYVNCAHCKGRLWVAKDAPADATSVETVAVAGSVRLPETPPKLRSSPNKLSLKEVEGKDASPPPKPTAKSTPTSTATPPGDKPLVEKGSAPLVPARPSTPLPSKRVARFITADATDSTLRLAADGKLPELHLEEGAAKEKPEVVERSVNPLVMVGVLAISVVLSIMLVLVDVESPPATGLGQKAQMRQTLADHYYGLGDLNTEQLEPYQILLRQAQQAYSRGDYKTEREHYRKVLDMLRAERGSEERGLTGSRSKDRKLEESLTVLLSGG